MSNVKVLIYVESRYKVNRKQMKKTIASVLSTNSVTSSVEVSVAIVGDRKMRSLNKKYRNLDKTTNVLSFPLREGEQTVINGTVSRLGDIVISYPQVIKEAMRDEMLVDEKVDQLLSHSMLHLLGIHHE
jgi:probable rRNA maturation factor